MSYLQYPSLLYVKTAESSERVEIGRTTVPDSQQLKYLKLHLFKHGAHAGTEKFRVNVYTDSTKEFLYATTNYFNLTDISNITAGDWIGRVRLDFTSEAWLESGANYWFEIETSGYTRNSATYYLSFVLDWPYPVNSGSSSRIVMELYPYRRISYG